MMSAVEERLLCSVPKVQEEKIIAISIEGLGIAPHPNSWLTLSRSNNHESNPYACL